MQNTNQNPLSSLEDWEDDILRRYPDPEILKKKDEFRNYQDSDRDSSVREFYSLDARALKQEEDVLDTWFSASLWPFGSLGWPKETEDFKKFFPTTLLVTGFDIIFFWVARMMMMSLELSLIHI
mgnify:CR=1 FL=1